MPGELLGFNCPCGFEAHEVWVGATPEGHYQLVSCRACERIASIFVHGGRALRATLRCRACGRGLTLIRDPGPDARETAGPGRCPKCGERTLQVVPEGNWD